MDLLKKQNWFVNVLLICMSGGLYIFVLAYLLKIYQKNAWYANYRYWCIGALCLFFPIFIMLFIFYIQIFCKVASKLNVPGKEIYAYPYAWILCFIVPVIGWILWLVMLIYIQIWIFVMLAKGEGELYITD